MTIARAIPAAAAAAVMFVVTPASAQLLPEILGHRIPGPPGGGDYQAAMGTSVAADGSLIAVGCPSVNGKISPRRSVYRAT